ncbi:hypothetical protein NKH16_11305 [Mesorhizobium sp. M1307]|uniref:hypothetical protein n=1 Tax=Mesorhizobium sp. M1307 TaxID=2957079 RepID=UPI00333C00AC
MTLELPVTPQPNADVSLDTIRQHVTNAVGCLHLINTTQMAPEYLAAWALQEIFMAAVGGADLTAIAPETSQGARRLLREVAPAVDASVKGKILSERLYFSLGVGSGLLAAGDDPFRADRLDYAGLMAAELRAIAHRRNLNSRGFPLLHDAHVQHAWAAPRDETIDKH